MTPKPLRLTAFIWYFCNCSSKFMNSQKDSRTFHRCKAGTNLSNGNRWYIFTALTIVFAVQIILFANEFIFIQNVELLTGGQLFPTHHASETFQMKHLASGSPHQVIGTDALWTTTTLGSKASENIRWKIKKINHPLIYHFPIRGWRKRWHSLCVYSVLTSRILGSMVLYYFQVTHKSAKQTSTSCFWFSISIQHFPGGQKDVKNNRKLFSDNLIP